jgi:phosphatidylserine decarboxylase
MPVSGVVEVNAYHPGQFLNASLDKASELNERQSLLVKTEHGLTVGCVQIAGLIARRIVCQAPEGQRFQAGQRFGIIRFGSRVDVYVPESCAIWVQVGQKSVGGETILAQLPASDG